MSEQEFSIEAVKTALQAFTAVGALVAATAGGPAVAVGGLITKEVVDTTGKRLFQRWRDKREERAAELLAAAMNEYHREVGTFTSTIEESPELLELLSAAVQAAVDTPMADKIYALAGCLARGVEDVAVVDAETLRVRGLARIENPEVMLMDVLSSGPDLQTQDDSLGWSRDKVLAKLPGFAAVLDAVVARLLAEGLAVDASVGTFGLGGPGRERWRLTDFGQDCLSLLRAAATMRDMDVEPVASYD